MYKITHLAKEGSMWRVWYGTEKGGLVSSKNSLTRRTLVKLDTTSILKGKLRPKKKLLIENSTLEGCEATECLSGNIRDSKIYHSKLEDVCELSNVSLGSCYVRKSNLSGTDATESTFEEATFQGVCTFFGITAEKSIVTGSTHCPEGAMFRSVNCILSITPPVVVKKGDKIYTIVDKYIMTDGTDGRIHRYSKVKDDLVTAVKDFMAQ